jgi:phosphoribosyl 1,2-cyclic phosphodiesterase
MLASGPYPASLQDRICGRGGHLSNMEAAQVVAGAGRRRLKWACLAHLSEQNNNPETALDTHREIYGEKLLLYVASRYEAVEMLEV